MAATPGDRRTPGRRPHQPGRSGRPSRPRRPGPGAAGRPERKRAERDRAATLARARVQDRRRSRLTGRAAILVLVLAVLAVSYASSLRAYLQQRHQIEAWEATVEDKEASIDDLAAETERWDDVAFLMKEARKLGFVKRGETPYVAIDDDGEPLTEAELDDPALDDDPPPAWYDGMWSSVKVAGNPPTRIAPQPKQRIVGSADE